MPVCSETGKVKPVLASALRFRLSTVKTSQRCRVARPPAMLRMIGMRPVHRDTQDKKGVVVGAAGVEPAFRFTLCPGRSPVPPRRRALILPVSPGCHAALLFLRIAPAFGQSDLGGELCNSRRGSVLRRVPTRPISRQCPYFPGCS